MITAIANGLPQPVDGNEHAIDEPIQNTVCSTHIPRLSRLPVLLTKTLASQ